ncbi:protein-tyrosine phosphatase-like protein [Schizophyllum amplum]|uniref:Protein-tyrosine phosphatase-like protein n=1 Tax=Schizophyllum amplum TaxID=97359 RepID=A0A550CTV5_9AGAR|nr:protein-tyrosine phosphatase-like protein [Auriculariopsis ampla]
MSDTLQPLDPQEVAETLSKPPFVQVSGVINIRDLGDLPSASFAPQRTKPHYMYRSAELSGISDEGKAQLKALGVTTVFDLRSDTEMDKYNTPVPNIEGIEIVRAPVFEKEDYSPEMMAKRFRLYASGKTEAFMELYTQILDNAASSFGAVFRHVRDRPSDGFLFHCTAGKDRTGILAALLLQLAGVDAETIARDYALTRIGREPAREVIMQRLSKEVLFASNKEMALNMLSCRSDIIPPFLKLLDQKYGGVEAYLKNYIGLTDDDIIIIRRHVLTEPPP